MVRNMSTSTWETWFRTAKEHLDIAERAFNSGLDEVAYEKAVYSGECALKAVLVKNGVFTRDDWTHDHRKIFDKIKELGLLSPQVLAQVEDIVTDRDGVEGLGWVDLGDKNPSEDIPHIDCAHIERTRYPEEEYSSYDMLRLGDAELKIKLAKKLIEVLENNF